MGKEGPFPAVGSSPCLKSNFLGHLDKLSHLSGPWSSSLDSPPHSDPNISVGPRAAAPRASSVSLGGARARSWRTCFPSGNALDRDTLGGTPGCSNLAAHPCSSSRTSEPQLAGAIGRPCPPHLPGPCSGSCLMGSPPASSQVRSPERRCIMATWLRSGAWLRTAAFLWDKPTLSPSQYAFLRPPHVPHVSATLLSFLFSELARLGAGLGP